MPFCKGTNDFNGLHPRGDVHPMMPAGLHARARVGGIDNGFDSLEFIPLSPVARECMERGLSLRDIPIVYEQMKRECHPVVICS